jgi:hypothetical protein
MVKTKVGSMTRTYCETRTAAKGVPETLAIP